MMADDLSWIDHPANLRANAALLRAIAEQSLLHAAEIERLREVLTDLRERSVEEGIQHFVTRIDAALTTGKRHD